MNDPDDEREGITWTAGTKPTNAQRISSKKCLNRDGDCTRELDIVQALHMYGLVIGRTSSPPTPDRGRGFDCGLRL